MSCQAAGGTENVNVTQCRMARAALDWSVADLAEAAAVDRLCVKRFETGDPLIPLKVEALRTAFEARGVRFLESGQFEGAVVPPEPEPIPNGRSHHSMLREMYKPECARRLQS
jgi:hypothetical protein